jgi:hypothetical protein
MLSLTAIVLTLAYIIVGTQAYCTCDVQYDNDTVIPCECNDIDSYNFCHNATLTYIQYATVLKHTLISKLDTNNYNIFSQTINYILPYEGYCYGSATCKVMDHSTNDTCISQTMYQSCVMLNSSTNNYNNQIHNQINGLIFDKNVKNIIDNAINNIDIHIDCENKNNNYVIVNTIKNNLRPNDAISLNITVMVLFANIFTFILLLM